MPRCDYHATLKDHKGLLSWLFEEETCHIYQSDSAWERPLVRFTGVDHVLAQFKTKYEVGDKTRTNVDLTLYVLGAGPPFKPKRIALNPDYCDGKRFRFSASDWGEVGLMMNVPSKRILPHSYTNHASQRRAEVYWEETHEGRDPALYDFKRVSAFSARFNREIKKRAVAKLGGYFVLPGAFEAWQRGTLLWPYRAGEEAGNMTYVGK